MGCTWVAGVLLIEAVNSAQHEVEDHLAVWIVHAWGWGGHNHVVELTKGENGKLTQTQEKKEINMTALCRHKGNIPPTYWFHLCLLNPHHIPQPKICSAPPVGRMNSYLDNQTRPIVSDKRLIKQQGQYTCYNDIILAYSGVITGQQWGSVSGVYSQNSLISFSEMLSGGWWEMKLIWVEWNY